MAVLSPLAGKPVDPAHLADVARLITACFTDKPDRTIASQRVSFGTSGLLAAARPACWDTWR